MLRAEVIYSDKVSCTSHVSAVSEILNCKYVTAIMESIFVAKKFYLNY